jgi:hypothetical protein
LSDTKTGYQGRAWRIVERLDDQPATRWNTYWLSLVHFNVLFGEAIVVRRLA